MPSALSALLRDGFAAGAALGFLVPVDDAELDRYWSSVAEEIDARRRTLIAAKRGGAVGGMVQVVPDTAANGRHRAEVQKLVVAENERGHGLARRLLEAAERRPGRAASGSCISARTRTCPPRRCTAPPDGARSAVSRDGRSSPEETPSRTSSFGSPSLSDLLPPAQGAGRSAFGCARLRGVDVGRLRSAEPARSSGPPPPWSPRT